MSSLTIRAIIFDLDGLVLDSEATYFAAWRMAAADMGQVLDDEFCAALSGLQGHQVYQRLQQHCGLGFDLDQFSARSRQHWLANLQQQAIAVKPGFFHLLSLIERLQLPFALATNSRRQDAEFCLANAGLADVFSLIVSRDQVSNGKPSPELFQLAARQLGLALHQCLVLEDSPIGIAAAKAAGCPCVFVPSQSPADAEACKQAEHVCFDLEQVADFVSACRAASL